MKNYVKIDCANRRIIMDRTFAKNAKIVGSEEYNKLQMARRDYEGFTVITRTISRNSKKECYSCRIAQLLFGRERQNIGGRAIFLHDCPGIYPAVIYRI